MLTILGGQDRFCDGISRRSFLRIGALALGGLSMAEILAAEAAFRMGRSHKAVIMVFLPGGPPHLDLFDLKTEAPVEIRGEFKPIKTNVAGIEISELMPRLAAIMDKLAVIRTIVGAKDRHDAFQCQTGRLRESQPAGGWPSLGSVLSKLHGPVNRSIPPFVGLAPGFRVAPWADPGQPGFLGTAHAPFTPIRAGNNRADMVLNGITLDRLADRKALLGSFDRFRRDTDAKGLMEGLDAFNEQAFGILTSSKLAEALDLEREDPRLRERYGRVERKKVGRDLHGPGTFWSTESFLMARRLVEAGVRCVTLAFATWDYHGNIFKRCRQDVPLLDRGVSALVEDLHQRGLDKDVSVVVWGEFGRTPKINKSAGRDHWPKVSCALLAGGAMRTGQVVGATNRLGEYAENRPVHFQDVFATLYHNLGIDVNKVAVNDLSGRPRYLVDHDKYQPMREVI